MCTNKRHGTLNETLDNLRQPMPIGRKFHLVVRNFWIKVRTRSDCCGNHGEPGC